MKQRPIVAVVDGQGGGVGRMLVERLRSRLGDRAEILALGTNVHATEQMLRAGADDGATGENAIRYNAPRAQVIVGVAAILAGNALLGELSPDMAAVSYTHLDVYKRQAHGFAHSFAHGFARPRAHPFGGNRAPDPFGGRFGV